MPGPDRIQIAKGYSISRIIVGGWQFSKGHGAHGLLGTDPVAVDAVGSELLGHRPTELDYLCMADGVLGQLTAIETVDG